jgi:hypothetical protein
MFRSRDFIIGSVILLVLLLVYWFTMPKVITFEDAGLFLQVCQFKGLTHPPGYPLFTILCIPWFWLPADPVILGNMLSAIFGALTCVLVYFILRRLNVSLFSAAMASLLFGLSRDFWSQAIIVEVYTLNTLLVSVAIYLALSFSIHPKRNYIFLLSFIFGLGISNHWPLVVLTTPGVLLISLFRWRELAGILARPVNVFVCIILIAIGLMPYLYLVLNQDPGFSYSGSISTIREFRAYVMRDAFAGVDQSGSAGPMDKIHFVGWLLERASIQFGLLFALVTLAGMARGLLIQRTLMTGLLVTFIGNTVVLVLLLGFDFDYLHQSVLRTYPLVAWLCMSIWFGYGLNWILGLVKERQAFIMLVSCIVFLLVIYENLHWNNRSDDQLADKYARIILENLSRDSSLVVTSDPQVGPISYLQQVVGLRRDVTLYEAQNLFFANKLKGASINEHRTFLKSLDSVHFIAIPWLSGNVDHGFFETVGSGEVSYKIVPGTAEFVDDLVQDFNNHKIPSPGTRYFAHQLLIALGNQLTHYAFTNEIDEDEVSILLSVQQTFPGVLATLSVSLANPQYPMPDGALLSLALPFDGEFGDETPGYEIAAYYYYLAMLMTYPDESLESNEELAFRFLLKGFEHYPVSENPGVCLGLSLARSRKLQDFEEFSDQCG